MDLMRWGEKKDFTSSYDEQKDKVFDTRRVLQQYCQDDVSLATSESDY